MIQETPQADLFKQLMRESLTNLKQIPCPKFFARLGSDALFAGFWRYGSPTNSRS